MKRFLLLLFLSFFAASLAAQPILCGHRGSLWGVENSEEAFVNGAKKGYTYLETDVKVSGDGKFVLIHDDDTKRLGGSLTVASSTLEQLKSETYTQTRGGVTYTGKICTLEEYLQICKDHKVFPLIELKWATGINNNDVSNLSRLVDVVISYGFGDDAIILTSMQPCLEHVRKNYPNFKLQFLCRANWSTQFDWCVENRIDADIQTGNFDKSTVTKFHEAGLKVNVWTVNDNVGYQTYGNYGCDFITVDYLDPTNLPELDAFSRLIPNKIDYPDNSGVVQEYYYPELVSTKQVDFSTTADAIVKRILFKDEKFYILFADVNGTSKIEIMDANTAEYMQHLTLPIKDTVMVSDMAFTADGKLMVSFDGLGKSSMWHVYTWEDDTSEPSLFLSTKMEDKRSGLSSFCVSGNRADCKIYTATYTEGDPVQNIHGFKVVDGRITSSIVNKISNIEESGWGTTHWALTVSPHSRDNIIIDNPKMNPAEFTFEWDKDGKEITPFMSMPAEIADISTKGINFFRYGGQIYSPISYLESSTNQMTIKLVDATRGLKDLISVADNLTPFSPSGGDAHMISGTIVDKGNIYIYTLALGFGISKYVIGGEEDEGNRGEVDFKLEKLWSYTGNENNAPDNIGGPDIQQGAAYKGVFYINDCAKKLIYMHGENGLIGTLPGGEGWGIACDDAGNIIVRNDKSTGADHKLLVYPSGTISNDVKGVELDLMLNEGGQTNFISASGNILGEKGGYVYFFPNQQNVINMVEIKEGVVVSVKTSDALALTAPTAGYVIPINNNSANWLYQVRNQGIYEYNGSDKGALIGASTNQTAPNPNTTCGGEFFKLSHHDIIIYNSGGHYLGGFTIKDLTDNKVITSVDPIGSKGYGVDDGNKSTANWTFAEKIDPGAYYIYQYCPANGIAVYRFYDANYKPVSIDENLNNNTISSLFLYPNPVSDVLYIESSEKIEKINIYSLVGNQVISHEGEDIKSVDVESLESGYYLIKANDLVGKFMKK